MPPKKSDIRARFRALDESEFNKQMDTVIIKNETVEGEVEEVEYDSDGTPTLIYVTLKDAANKCEIEVGLQGEESELDEEIVEEENLVQCNLCSGDNFDENGQCTVCDPLSTDPQPVEKPKKEFVCKTCGLAFRTEKKLELHSYIHGRQYMCQVCDKLFNTRSACIIHIRTHTGEKPYTCQFCGKSFADQSSFTVHTRIHTGQKPYKCDTCDKSFSKMANLRTHNRVHTGEKPYQCEICDKSFFDGSTRNRHRLTHSNIKEEPKFQCTTCNKKFFKKLVLENHVEKYHSAHIPDPFKCSFCTVQFYDHSLLRAHMKTHSEDRRFACDQCDKMFRRKHHLTIHMISHSQKKDYSCPECGGCFAQKSGLNLHLKKKSCTEKVLNYKCDVCEKRFTELKSLKLHLRIHTGEKPYECGHCFQKFSRLDSLKVHLKVSRKCRMSELEAQKNSEKSGPNLKSIKIEKNLTGKSVKIEKNTQDEKPSPVKSALIKTLKEVKREKVVEKKRTPVNEVTIIEEEDDGFMDEVIPTSYSCQFCDQCFADSKDLRIHELEHVVVSEIEQLDSPANELACDICGLLCDSIRDLKNHILSHVSKLECHNCQKQFSKAQDLNQHILVCEEA